MEYSSKISIYSHLYKIKLNLDPNGHAIAVIGDQRIGHVCKGPSVIKNHQEVLYPIITEEVAPGWTKTVTVRSLVSSGDRSYYFHVHGFDCVATVTIVGPQGINDPYTEIVNSVQAHGGLRVNELQ